jgi:hypothetical protein
MAAEILDVHGATAPNEFKLGWEPVAALLLLLLCDYCYPQTRRYQAPEVMVSAGSSLSMRKN